jgi:phenylpropionate dioxygenase-like ring-hydroxylating dioxygenase large terminal subunit
MAIDYRSRLDSGVTLPFSWFADPQVFAEEQAKIFGRYWQYVGVTHMAPEPGSFFTAKAGLVPVVVVRDHDGRLNGFVNICRHRATQVAEGCGKRETLQCPYHAWTYNLDGSLRTAPRSELEPGFDKSRLGLRRVAVDTWGPLVFVNRDLDAPPLAEFLGTLPETVAATGIDLGQMRYVGRDEQEIAANWKAVVENYLECYHCSTSHPGFSKVINVDPGAYELSSRRWQSSQIAPVRDNLRRGAEYNPSGAITQSQFHYVWPMFTVNIMPGPTNLVTFSFVPLSPGRTLAISDSFFGADATEQQIEDLSAFGNQVFVEDQALVESIQVAAESGGLEEGQLLLSSEHLIQHFQRLVDETLSD